MSFKDFLKESSDNLDKLYTTIAELSEEEIDELGEYIVNNFLDDLDTDDDEGYDIIDVREMIAGLNAATIEIILDMLEYDTDEDTDDDLQEADVSRIMKSGNMNRKRRKYMGSSHADLNRTRAKRRQEARKSKVARKRYYKVNKTKIANYQKSRRDAIKKGKHNVKLRKKA